MKFNAIVGNPPYQQMTGGSRAQATAVYNYFFECAIALKPGAVSMIMPSRWFSGGFGLDTFRANMISDKRIRFLKDFIQSQDCFTSSVEIKGGVCYLLWDSVYNGPCDIYTVDGPRSDHMKRYLKESGVDAFIRRSVGVAIYKKVAVKGEQSMMDLVSSQKPFGLGTAYFGKKNKFDGCCELYQNGGIGYIKLGDVPKDSGLINKYKVFISAGYNAGDTFPHQVINKPLVAGKNSCCTETYVAIGTFNVRKEAENLASYIRTKFFRFMVLLLKNSQHALKKVYQLVPVQDFSKPWTDAELYKKYKLTKDEIAFIESMIKPME